MSLLSSVTKPVSGFFSWFGKASLLVKIIVIAIVLGAGWLIYSRTLGAKKNTIQYETAQATKGTLITSVDGSGNISTGNVVSITTQATGVITNVYVKNGDTVTQGEKIADITLD